ncbi:uncharacterized protein LOC127261068 isoform X2 [Andrographis paniculata]|uniref:uncharacterized protein LOC127261068 isoform X2 n=1 Tax=Andrographis paniculata TaxID=175694 RepID=UPI0021E6DA51|nr:uncharacterized protein LOC127261068 isoform X2 [Andrographis paniculata]
MISLRLTSSPSFSLSLKPCCLPTLRPIHTRYKQVKRLKQGECRAEFSLEAPVGAAIGACILSSLVLPAAPPPEDAEAESLIDSTDARFAVMGIIGFIPYFNWMSWVFAWLDTGKRRYAVYAIVYLLPYLRTNLSISPEDSWLPIASILLCLAHIQLEASIKNGDIQGFQFFSRSISRESEERKDFHNLPSAEEHYRNKIREWAAPQQDPKSLNKDEDSNGDSNKEQ